MEAVRRAGLSGKIGSARRRGDHDLVLFLDDSRERQSNAARRNVDDHVHFLSVEPAPRNRGGDVRLVLPVGGDDFDRNGLIGGAETLLYNRASEHPSVYVVEEKRLC
jgi:hypothetical protein